MRVDPKNGLIRWLARWLFRGLCGDLQPGLVHWLARFLSPRHI